MELRQAALWTALLFAFQTIDVLTTSIDRAWGTVESMPISARLLELGGVSRLWSAKLLLVVAAGLALLLTARWARRDRPASKTTFRFCLVGVQATTMGLTWVSLNNVALLASLVR